MEIVYIAFTNTLRPNSSFLVKIKVFTNLNSTSVLRSTITFDSERKPYWQCDEPSWRTFFSIMILFRRNIDDIKVSGREREAQRSEATWITDGTK